VQKMKVHVKKDDTVVVLSGRDKGKRGKVLEVFPREGKRSEETHSSPASQGSTGRHPGEGSSHPLLEGNACMPPLHHPFPHWPEDRG